MAKGSGTMSTRTAERPCGITQHPSRDSLRNPEYLAARSSASARSDSQPLKRAEWRQPYQSQRSALLSTNLGNASRAVQAIIETHSGHDTLCCNRRQAGRVECTRSAPARTTTRLPARRQQQDLHGQLFDRRLHRDQHLADQRGGGQVAWQHTGEPRAADQAARIWQRERGRPGAPVRCYDNRHDDARLAHHRFGQAQILARDQRSVAVRGGERGKGRAIIELRWVRVIMQIRAVPR